MTGPFNQPDPTGENQPQNQGPPPGQNPPPQQMPPPQANPYDSQPANPFGAPPANPYGAPQQQAMNYPSPYAQPKKAKWPWVVLGVVILLIFLVGGCFYWVWNTFGEPVSVTEEYFTALEQNDVITAYSLLCEASQSSVTASQFSTEASQFDISEFEFTDFTFLNDTAQVSGNLTVNGFEEFTTIDLLLENDEWKVCDSGIIG